MAAAGALLGVVGTVFQMKASMDQASAEKDAERLRKRQMNLEIMRKKREEYRKGQIARAETISSATAAGAETSSAVPGGLASITGSVNRNVTALNQDKQIGSKIFAANAAASDARGLAGIGAGISSLGNIAFAIGSMGSSAPSS